MTSGEGSMCSGGREGEGGGIKACAGWGVGYRGRGPSERAGGRATEEEEEAGRCFTDRSPHLSAPGRDKVVVGGGGHLI